MDDPSQVLASNLASLAEARKKRPARALTTDRTLQALVAHLVAARVAAGMTQEEVAARMRTTSSVVSHPESGVRTRPTLTTIERYAVAVGATVETRLRISAPQLGSRFSAFWNSIANPVARSRAVPRGTVRRIGELAPPERQAAAADALGESRFEALQLADTFVDA